MFRSRPARVLLNATQVSTAKYVTPRYPNATTLGGIRTLDYVGTCAFAMSGAITAAESGLDLLGGSLVGAITALGGGTVRDTLCGYAPTFWFEEREYLYMALGSAFATYNYLYWVGPPAELVHKVLFWGDTLGLGAFAVIGSMFGVNKGYNFVFVLMATLLTCTCGGVIRDIICQRPVRIMNSYVEIYATCTMMGSVVHQAARAFGAPLPLRIGAGFFTVVGMRCYASAFDIRLPVACPKRNPLEPVDVEEGQTAAAAAIDTVCEMEA